MSSYDRVGGICCTVLLCLLVSLIAIALPQSGSQFSAHAAASAGTAQVTVNTAQSAGKLTDISRGLNTAVWDGNLLDSAAAKAIKNTNVQVLRYPGGSTSDVYHWQSNNTVPNQGYANPANTFDAFMKVVQKTGTQPVITANYGSGTPEEAAAWVQYANKGGHGYNGPVPTYSGASTSGHRYGVKYWEIGNELYGNGTYGATWEYDTHAMGPATYASNVVAYSQAMKAVDAGIHVGAVLTAPGNWPDGQVSASSPQPWNDTVLPAVCPSVDFVVAHWYPQGPGAETDAGLLSSTSQIASMTATLRAQINQYCGSRASHIQIMVTETNSVSYNPGKQTVGLVNALFLADNYMSWLENGVANVDWWDLHNSASGGNNNSAALYGDAQDGDYGVLSNGTCISATSNICEPAANTPFPAYYGLQMLSKLGRPGDTMVSASSNQSLVAVHAVKQRGGKLAILLINKDPANSYTVSLAFNGYHVSKHATIYTYGQQSSAITSQSGSASSVTLAPYSLTTVVLHSGDDDASTH
ncbi:alpha-L-arabinofuranosidase [Dictyobacter alpinus]|uniref:Alpha-L-arabinofuranosidase n=1 Tax=Dictyobacter alpinus TaxID=2014873 RepID=A0A402BAG2_9CHLR|nr:alpha-L-arabinofuranosidase [Dictyobacter alpinus]